jgi:hypothetical protein
MKKGQTAKPDPFEFSVAERRGFEPPVAVKPHTLSRIFLIFDSGFSYLRST